MSASAFLGLQFWQNHTSHDGCTVQSCTTAEQARSRKTVAGMQRQTAEWPRGLSKGGKSAVVDFTVLGSDVLCSRQCNFPKTFFLVYQIDGCHISMMPNRPST